MKIQIEDYFGNDIIILKFCKVNMHASQTIINQIGNIAENHKYNVADIDIDEYNKPYIRVQNMNKSEVNQKADLIKLVSELNENFL